MKCVAMVLAVLLIGADSATTQKSPTTKPALDARWKLAWSDEFNQPGRPDPKTWSYEVGFIRNHESQYYTRDRQENARVEDGKLIIEGRKERFKNEQFSAKSTQWSKSAEFAEYTSACLVTLGKRSFHYGRLEVRAKLPAGQGVWPAIWMMGDDVKQVGWPRCGELDVMELVWEKPHRIHGTIHWPNPDTQADKKSVSSGGHIDDENLPSDDFHVYAIERDEHKIDFYYDSTLYKTVSIDAIGKGDDNPFHHPMYLLVNFAIGGSWGGQVDEKIFPQKFEIDYVRWYELKK